MNFCVKHQQIYSDFCVYCGAPIPAEQHGFDALMYKGKSVVSDPNVPNGVILELDEERPFDWAKDVRNPDSPAMRGLDAVVAEPEPPKKPRKKYTLSPEKRAAAAERMRALQARRKALRENISNIEIGETEGAEEMLPEDETTSEVPVLYHYRCVNCGLRFQNSQQVENVSCEDCGSVSIVVEE